MGIATSSKLSDYFSTSKIRNEYASMQICFQQNMNNVVYLTCREVAVVSLKTDEFTHHTKLRDSMNDAQQFDEDEIDQNVSREFSIRWEAATKEYTPWLCPTRCGFVLQMWIYNITTGSGNDIVFAIMDFNKGSIMIMYTKTE